MDRAGIGSYKLIGLLLAVNLGVFLAGMAMQRWMPAAPAPLVFNAEKIRLLALPAGANARLAAPAPDAAVKSHPRCLSWRTLDADGLAAIEAHLAQAGISADAYDIELENEPGKKLGWWVFLPPLKGKVALQAAIDELRGLGVDDYAPVRGGSMRNAISLGAFAKLVQAREHAAKLSGKGIKGVKYGPRPETGAARLAFSAAVPETALANANTDWPNALTPARCATP